MVHRRRFVWVLLVLLLPLFIACGGAEDETAPATSPAAETEASPSDEQDVVVETPNTEAVETEETPGPPQPTYTLDTPPEVPQDLAQEASQYSGTTITFYGSGPGIGGDMDAALEQQFTEATGIQIRHLPTPQSASELYSTYQRFFQAQSPDIDVMMIDVIWPGAFAPHLEDLTPHLGELAQQHYETIIENNTVDGKLVAMPWFGDFGMLYYRTDLLGKYGFDGPPKTWDELEQMARTVMEGERQEGNENFVGFVFQGNAYEGLTCDALEWVASTTGHTFIENGAPMLAEPEVAEILNKAKSWVGTIAPRGVTTYQENETATVFLQGLAMFARNWPYMYAMASDPEQGVVSGKFDVAPLPAAEGQEHVGTVGGWQIAVSNYSDAKEAAIMFTRYITSPEVQKYRAIVGAFVPTLPSVTEDPQVVEQLPYLKLDVTRVTRPSAELEERYNQGSTYIFQGVNQILNGAEPMPVLQGIEQHLERLLQ